MTVANLRLFFIANIISHRRIAEQIPPLACSRSLGYLVAPVPGDVRCASSLSPPPSLARSLRRCCRPPLTTFVAAVSPHFAAAVLLPPHSLLSRRRLLPMNRNK